MKTKVTVHLKHVAFPVVFTSNDSVANVQMTFAKGMSDTGIFSVSMINGFQVFRREDIAGASVEKTR